MTLCKGMSTVLSPAFKGRKASWEYLERGPDLLDCESGCGCGCDIADGSGAKGAVLLWDEGGGRGGVWERGGIDGSKVLEPAERRPCD